MKCVQRGSVLNWTERKSGAVLFSFDMGNVAQNVSDQVFAYGVRQIIADGGADADTLSERLAKMQVRADQLADGTWGTRVARLVDGDIFAAICAVHDKPDNDETRAKWAALKPAQRRALGERAEIKAWLVANSPDDDGDDTADLLETF